MSKKPYKDFYEASRRGGEWSGINSEKARKRIKQLEETASWNGRSVDSLIKEESYEMGC